MIKTQRATRVRAVDVDGQVYDLGEYPPREAREVARSAESNPALVKIWTRSWGQPELTEDKIEEIAQRAVAALNRKRRRKGEPSILFRMKRAEPTSTQSSTEAPATALTEAPATALTEAPATALTETELETEPETELETEPETELETEPETELETEPETEPQSTSSTEAPATLIIERLAVELLADAADTVTMRTALKSSGALQRLAEWRWSQVKRIVEAAPSYDKARALIIVLASMWSASGGFPRALHEKLKRERSGEA